MSAVLWFVLGVLCGVGLGVSVRWWAPKDKTDVEKSETTQVPSRKWVETRNFLYYDGTEMPVIKEDLNEQ